jgi:hypothetical protein
MSDHIVLACGSRDTGAYGGFQMVALVKATLDALVPKPDAIVNGDCPSFLSDSVDQLVQSWCYRNGVPCINIPAQWHALGKRAGPIRNAWMLRFLKVSLVVAFPGGKGTADMVGQAKAAGIPVKKVTLLKP